jgi:hypothetical protein
MTKPIIRVHNVETNEVIDREMNDEEFVIWEADKQTQLNKKAEAELQAQTKAILLDRLGITAEEARLLLS